MKAFILSKEFKYAVGENIIATIKMRKYFWYHLKMVIFQVTIIFSLSPLRARKGDNYRYRDNFRKRAIKKEAKN